MRGRNLSVITREQTGGVWELAAWWEYLDLKRRLQPDNSTDKHRPLSGMAPHKTKTANVRNYFPWKWKKNCLWVPDSSLIPGQAGLLWASTACYGDIFALLYVDHVHTSKETHLWTSKACYGDSTSFLYVDDVRTSRETHLWAFTACYGDIFALLYVDDVHTSKETHLWITTAC
jgi:hypothetical protein